MAVDPGDWTVSAYLSRLDPELARLLEIQHFKPIDPESVPLTDTAQAAVGSYCRSIVALAAAAKVLQTVAAIPGSFGQMYHGGTK